MRFVLALVVNLVRLVLWPLRVLASARAAPRSGWVKVTIDGPVVEVASHPPFWEGRSPVTSLHQLRRLVDVCAEDARVVGLLVVLRGWQGGSATATSLRRVLLAARERNKRLVVYLPRGGGTRTMYVASAAERIIVAPQSQLSPLGFAVQAQYLKEGLDRVGVEPEVLAHGRFKTAGETLVASEMSAAQREQLEALLDDAYETLIDALVEGRGVSRKLAEQWVDDGPWSATAAIRQGLVDASAHEDELPKKLDPERQRGAPLVGFRRYLRRRVLRWVPWRRKPRIGVVELHGPIAGRAAAMLPMATGEHFTSCIERAIEDRSVRGVILHVSSPGGSVLVSDQMLHGVRRLADKKPVVACFGDIAASGGYLAALGTAAIFAEPTTITGSIGVVAARFGVAPLLAKLGIAVETVKRGRRADMHSPVRSLAADEKEVVQRELEEVYGYFVEAVARARGRTFAEIEPLAQGRVYSGIAARRLGLIDGVGGFPEAMRELRRRIGGRDRTLEPQVVGAGWRSALIGRLHPAAAEVWSDVVAMMLAGGSERSWLWCASRLVDRD